MKTQGGKSLSGSRRQKSKVALLLIDVINDMEFPQGKQLRRHAASAAVHIAALKRRAKRLGIPAVYVNDNFGRWQSDFSKLVRHCLEDSVCGESIARLLVPDEDDYFVLKPKHSGFFSTTLGVLLRHLETETLILTGFATNICVLYTANDAYMRGFKILIPRDCVAAEQEDLHERALAHMKRCLKAAIRPAARIRLRALLDS